MKKIFLFSIFILSFLSLLNSNVSAEVLFSWVDYDVDVDKRLQIESIFGDVAHLYLNENYSELGPLDFVSDSEQFTVRIEPGLKIRENTNWGAGRGGSLLEISPDLLNDVPTLEAVLARELSHMYDLAMTYRLSTVHGFLKFPIKYRPKIKVGDRRIWIKHYFRFENRNLGEFRAFKKEEEYIWAARKRFGENKFNELLKAVQKAKNELEDSK